MDVIKEVAEAKCQCVRKPDGSHHEECNPDGLRWPALSRECECIRYLRHKEHDWLGCKPCSACLDASTHSDECIFGDGATRIPDVTLEKLCTVVDTLKVDLYCDGWQAWINIEDNDFAAEGYGIGDSPLEAACTALLKVAPEPAREPQ